jgi:bacterioferritin-associated ferredoxin
MNAVRMLALGSDCGRCPKKPKRVYYLSMEFLIGPSLTNNIINLLLGHTLDDDRCVGVEPKQVADAAANSLAYQDRRSPQ